MALVADAFDAPVAARVFNAALPVSLLAHGALLVAALWFLRPVPLDDQVQLESIAVTLVTMQTASDSQAVSDGDAAQAMIAAGVNAVATAEPIEEIAPTETLTSLTEPSPPVAAEIVQVAPPETSEALIAEQAVRVSPTATTADAPAQTPLPIRVEAAQPATSDATIASAVERPPSVGPTAVADALVAKSLSTLVTDAPTPIAMAPVIQLRATIAEAVVSQRVPSPPISPLPSIEAAATESVDAVNASEASNTAIALPPTETVTPLEAVDPTEVEPPLKTKPAQQKPHKPKPPVKPQQLASTGSGGKDNADAAASSAAPGGAGQIASGGSAAESRYPGLVQARLKRALRFPPGAGASTGEAHVRFLVHADGSVSGIEVVKSAGSSVLDDAARATVQRAAPFPPIPASAQRANWSFTMPLRFRR